MLLRIYWWQEAAEKWWQNAGKMLSEKSGGKTALTKWCLQNAAGKTMSSLLPNGSKIGNTDKMLAFWWQNYACKCCWQYAVGISCLQSSPSKMMLAMICNYWHNADNTGKMMAQYLQHYAGKILFAKCCVQRGTGKMLVVKCCLYIMLTIGY